MFVLLAALLIASIALDAFVRPCRSSIRHWSGLLFHGLTMTATFGLCLAVSGNAYVAAALALALMALFMAASNAKNAVLGEPLVFSDLALLSFVLRHPRFYFSAVPAWQRWIAAIVALVAALTLGRLSSLALAPHLAGVALLILASGALWPLLHSGWARQLTPTPDLHRDVARHGLLATLLLYWRRWRESPDPQPCPAISQTRPDAPELIIVVQCESFADPVEITGGTGHRLPGLAAAQTIARQWGDLAVSGFGAYTMRSEYAVLFGRGEDALGFRRFDPFLTALRETSYALSARLKGAGYRAIFVHPYDMRFYGRDRLMPAIGFDALVGQEGFPPVPQGARYVDDRTLGRKLIELAQGEPAPLFLYAVTMENHGPWEGDAVDGPESRLDTFLRRLRSSDDMLNDLIDSLRSAGRPACLVFFGDHRPSIPGVVVPGEARHTPYILVRFDAEGRPITGGTRADLTPAELHHAILACVDQTDGKTADQGAIVTTAS
jgi:hypothetical protein